MRCCSRERRHGVGRAMRRSELWVLVGRVVRPPELVRWRVLRILAVPLLRLHLPHTRSRLTATPTATGAHGTALPCTPTDQAEFADQRKCNQCTVSGNAHIQSRVDDLTDAAGVGAAFRTMGGFHADVPGGSDGLDFYAVGARADLTPAQFGELSDLGDTEFGFRVPQPARLVARADLWHAEVTAEW